MPDIDGLRQAQAACLRLLAATTPQGALGRGIKAGLVEGTRRAVVYTPVDTGSWRASHRAKLDGLTGQLFIDPAARNVRSGTPVRRYAAGLAKRGGRYDVYGRVARDEAAIAEAMARAALEDIV